MHLMDIKLLSPSCWSDYELIDSGAFEKLERFGRYHGYLFGNSESFGKGRSHKERTQ